MPEGLSLETEKTDIQLRQLSIEDAGAYYAAIDANRAHLSQFDDLTSDKYPDLESVKASIERPADPSKLRFGIWDRDEFVGSINATPTAEGIEIGYWLDGRRTGNGYATIATRALTKYLQAQSPQRIYAEVAEGNEASTKVLMRAGYRKAAANSGRIIFNFAGYIPPLLEDGEIDLNQLAEDKQAGVTPPPIPLSDALANMGHHGIHLVNPAAHSAEDLSEAPDLDAIRRTLKEESE